jgi:hypothetical protein
MRNISPLSKEEKLIELSLDMQTKQSMGQIMGSSNPMYILDSELEELFGDVIDDIWYITPSPNFDFENKFYQTDNFKIESKKDVNDIFKSNKNKAFIWYNILLNPLIYTTNKSYMIRGIFVDNLQHSRNEKINQILDE